MKKILFVFAFCGFLSCEKESAKPQNNDSLIFGTYHGFCKDECATLFKIENQAVYADKVSNYQLEKDNLTFETTPLDNNKYLLAKDLLTSFPDALRTSKDTIFGCPDCHDQGVIFLKLKENGITKNWYIDTDDDAVIGWLLPYAQSVKNAVQKMK